MPQPAVPPHLFAGRYAIERTLGRGGSATVYLARDVRGAAGADRVAVKVLREELAFALGAERFAREIALVSRLEHPHILSVLDSGETEEALYFVMPYVPGRTLRARLERERQLAVRDVARLGAELAGALAYAHAKGVVHRDVKPENVLLAEDGRAILADFGLGQTLEPETAERLTSSGVVLGTPAYMSPEQASGAREVDGRSDQYSLACVLYEALAGVAPYVGPTPRSVMMQRVLHPPHPVSAMRREVPNGMAAAVMRALSTEPVDRYGTMGAFGEAWETIVPPPPRRWWTVGMTPKRLAVAGAVTAVATGAAGYRVWPRTYMPAPGPLRVALVATGGRSGADAAGPLEAVAAVGRVVASFGVVALTVPAVHAAEDPDADERLVKAARARRAHYAIAVDGAGGPSLGVVLRLVDARTGRVVERVASTDASLGDTEGALGGGAVRVVRTLALRDSLFPAAYRTLLQASNSSRALTHLAAGQRRFGRRDVSGARDEYRRALAADSSCLLAFHRLSVLEDWDFDFEAAYDLAQAGLRAAEGRDDRWTRLLRAQRYFSMRAADSALAAFTAAVADDPDNVDGWFGLSQSTYYFGWVEGREIADARAAFDAVLRIDSSFATIHGAALDAALAGGDTSGARTLLAHIEHGLPWRQAKEFLVRYAAADVGARDTLLREAARFNRYTLSELVLHLARTLRDPRAADRVAALMQSPGQTSETRRRGAQYRLALASREAGVDDPAVRRARDSAPDVFDPWLAARVLGRGPNSLRPALREAARGAIPGTPTRATFANVASPAVQAVDFLVQDALDDASGARAVALGTLVDAAARLAHPANPVAGAWRATLDARAALSRSDSSAAIAALRRATRRIAEPYGAFLPLTSLPTQRRLLAALLRATRMPATEVTRVESSFFRSWSIADAMFVERPFAFTADGGSRQ